MTTVGIVTGAGRGMGLACARRLAPTVDHLLLVDLDGDAASAAADEITASGGAQAEAIEVDIADRDGLGRLADRAAEAGTLRSVAHAAGISPTMADWRRVFTVDLVATAWLVDAVRPLVTAGTAFVCFASMAPHLAFPDAQPVVDAVLDDPRRDDFLEALHDAVGDGIEDTGMAYAWAKRGVQRFVRREAVRLGPAGGRICSVSPGMIDTPMNTAEMEEHAYMALLLEQTPLGRMGRADELAEVVAFLLSDGASFLSGTDVLVDGGVTAAIHSAPPGG